MKKIIESEETEGLLAFLGEKITVYCLNYSYAGTLIGVAHRAGLLDKDGNLPKMREALIADSFAAMFGSLIGTYLVYKGKSVVGPFPKDILNIPLTSFSTFNLLMSSLAMGA